MIRVEHLPSDEAPSVGRMFSYAFNDFGLFVVCEITDTTIASMIKRGLLHSFSVAGPFLADENGIV